MKTVHRVFATSCFALAAFVLSAGSVAAQSASADLARLLVGEYDSQRQMQEDQANNVPKEMSHARINRTFVSTDAPDVSDIVLVGTTAYAANPWIFDHGEFIVWTFTEGEDGNSTVMAPRRFKDLDRRIPFARDGEKLGGFTPDDLEGAVSGAACEIVWTRNGDGFSGRSKPCYVMSTTKKKMLDWQWTFELSDDALWISFAGVDENGDVLDGTPEGSPYRLDRVK